MQYLIIIKFIIDIYDDSLKFLITDLHDTFRVMVKLCLDIFHTNY